MLRHPLTRVKAGRYRARTARPRRRRGNQSPSGALISARFPTRRNVYQERCRQTIRSGAFLLRHPLTHVRAGRYRTRTAAEATAACGGNREPRLGPRSDFLKPCQGAAEKSANATRKALTVRFCCGSHPLGMSTEELPAAVQNSGLFYLVGVPGGTLPPRQYFLLKKHVQSLWKTVVSRGLHMLFCSALFLYCSQRFICCRICAISALE